MLNDGGDLAAELNDRDAVAPADAGELETIRLVKSGSADPRQCAGEFTAGMAMKTAAQRRADEAARTIILSGCPPSPGDLERLPNPDLRAVDEPLLHRQQRAGGGLPGRAGVGMGCAAPAAAAAMASAEDNINRLAHGNAAGALEDASRTPRRHQHEAGEAIDAAELPVSSLANRSGRQPRYCRSS